MSIPDEPEQLRLWMEIAARRAELVEGIEASERGASDPAAAPRWRDVSARAAADQRKQLAALDRALKAGARDDRQDRGLSMRQLRDLATGHVARLERDAAKAVEYYLRHRGPVFGEGVCGQLEELHYFVRGTLPEPLDVQTLAELEKRARALRADGSGSLAALAKRIVALATE